MKMIKKIISVVLGIIICATIGTSGFIVSANTETINNDEQKIFSKATIDNEFADNRVIVVFKNKASLAFAEYNSSSFPEIDCKDVRNLTLASFHRAKSAVDKAVLAAEQRMTVKIDEDVDIASFKTIVCLTLEQSGKSYVIDAINKLKERDDILYVGPDMK